MQICNTGIEIHNNKSKIFDNTISKSFENGILIKGEDNKTRTMPLIWKNKIEQSNLDGILVYG